MMKVSISTVKKINIAVFSLVALGHIWRAATSKSLIIGSTGLPVWLSWVVALILIVVIYLNWKAE